MIRAKGKIKKGKVVLTSPVNYKDGADVDLIIYINRDDGENLDKRATTFDIDVDNNIQFIKERSKTSIDDSDEKSERETKTYDDKDESIQSRLEMLVNRVELSILITFLQNEHPQLTAIVIEMLDKSRAVSFMEALPAELQGELILRISKQKKVSSDVLSHIYDVISKKLSQSGKEIGNRSGGIDSAVEILSRMNNIAGGKLLKHLEDFNKGLSEELRKKMLSFEDIEKLSCKSIAFITGEVDANKLAIALKDSPRSLQEKIISNIDDREKKKKLKDVLNKLESVRTKDIEIARNEVLEVIRNIDDASLDIIKFDK